MYIHCFWPTLLSFLACVISSVYQGLCGLIVSSLFCTGACWSKILLSDEKYNLTRSSCPAVDKLFTIDVRSFEKTSFLILFIFRYFTSDQCSLGFFNWQFTQNSAVVVNILSRDNGWCYHSLLVITRYHIIQRRSTDVCRLTYLLS